MECSEECSKLERNKRIALALQIRNPELSAKITPRYSDFMKDYAKRDPKFCSTIHDELAKLVQLAKEVKFLFLLCYVTGLPTKDETVKTIQNFKSIEYFDDQLNY